MQPFSIVDCAAFHDLIFYVRGTKAHNSDIPHRTKMSDYIDELGDEIQANLKDEFKSLLPDRHISLTHDGWTSSTMIPFIGVTAHYVDASWRLNAALLFFGELPGLHSGENLAKCLYDITVEYGIVNKNIEHNIR